MEIRSATTLDYKTIMSIWERSVRATHHFLREGYIEELKPLILAKYLPAVGVFVLEDDAGNMLGFIGVLDRKVEMLFVDPEYFKMGAGKKLMRFAINELGADKVDVNEQNQSARCFYESIGFKTTSRSPVDGEGQPYPVLHLGLGL